MPSTLPAGSRNHANTSDAFGSIRRTICMPPTHTDEGLRAAIALRRQHPDVGVLMFSQYVETRYATQLLAKSSAGVGYLLKDRVADVGDFIEALKRVAAGGTALDPEVVTQLLGASRQAAALDASLTRRESEVLELMAEGRSNAAIADALIIGEGAVEKHVATSSQNWVCRSPRATTVGSWPFCATWSRDGS